MANPNIDATIGTLRLAKPDETTGDIVVDLLLLLL